jgi:hypothetical protein
MPARSVARYYRRAKELLLDRLFALQEATLSVTLHCPACGVGLPVTEPPETTDVTCVHCRTEIQLVVDPSTKPAHVTLSLNLSS